MHHERNRLSRELTEAISVKGKLKRPSLDTTFRNDWELGFRDLPNDAGYLFWQKPSNTIFSGHWGKNNDK